MIMMLRANWCRSEGVRGGLVTRTTKMTQRRFRNTIAVADGVGSATSATPQCIHDTGASVVGTAHVHDMSPTASIVPSPANSSVPSSRRSHPRRPNRGQTRTRGRTRRRGLAAVRFVLGSFATGALRGVGGLFGVEVLWPFLTDAVWPFLTEAAARLANL